MDENRSVQLAAMDWPWKSEDPGIGIILVSDQQLLNLAEHPDEAVEKTHPQAPEPVSLREHCRRGAQRGATKLRIAYDYFFGGSERGLYPDTKAFQEALKKVHDVAREYGLGLEPSILSPLELGLGYKARTGESGRWMHYREGLRDPETGAYSVQMWLHKRWCNNKGPTPIALTGARAFAFREERIPGTPFFHVDPRGIIELEPPEIEELPGAVARVGALDGGVAEPDAMFRAVRARVYPAAGRAEPAAAGLDRVLVVLIYETVEMDYFSPSAAEFLRDLVHQYHEQGISLAGLYSDEMHIQQDWSYHAHMDAGQFALRYVSPGFERTFAATYGAPNVGTPTRGAPSYADFAPYLVYFASHQHDFLPTHEPKLPCQHVFSPSAVDVRETLLFRRHYYDLLEGGVVRQMIDARDELERLNGRTRPNGRALDAFYHATWAESPTCDAWAPGGVHQSWSPEEHQRRYEYTPDFLWSNTVHQAAAACANYFRWNDFLSGGNDDTPEGGYADRNYYGRALACSLAALNRQPLASAGMWGMPAPVRERMQAVSAVYGAGGHPAFRSVVDYAPRQIEVLFLYPQDLVAVEERFGSWMVQYGYANTITAEKLLEHGHVTRDGRMEVKGARYRTVCVLYEPFPYEQLLTMLRRLAAHGGTVIWSSVPPLLCPDGSALGDIWMEKLFGVYLEPTTDPLGLALPARQVQFEGALARVEPMSILTDMVVDRVFPIHPMPGIQTVATVHTGGPTGMHPGGTRCVGARKAYPGGGQAIYLGFRPRDDQAASTGREARTWFDILHTVGAYAGDDNPTVVSRTTDYLACTFPNGATALCPHYRTHAESWPGGFFRDAEQDERLMRENPPPSDVLAVQGLRVAGHTVTYRGRHAVAYRLAGPSRSDTAGRLVAFAGVACTGIELDGRAYAWSDEPVDVAWHPLQPNQATAGYRPLYRAWCNTAGRVRLPLGLEDEPGLEVWRGAGAGSGRVGYGYGRVPFQVEAGALVLDVDAETAGHWLYVVRAK